MGVGGNSGWGCVEGKAPSETGAAAGPLESRSSVSRDTCSQDPLTGSFPAPTPACLIVLANSHPHCQCSLGWTLGAATKPAERMGAWQRGLKEEGFVGRRGITAPTFYF